MLEFLAFVLVIAPLGVLAWAMVLAVIALVFGRGGPLWHVTEWAIRKVKRP